MSKLYILILLVLLSVAFTSDKGQMRLKKLRERSHASSNRIIEFSKDDFKDLWPEYEYTAELYDGTGAIDAEKNPTFFVVMKYSNDLQDIFKTFGFTSAPNLVVSKPYMAVVSELQKKQYLQGFKWAISYSDGHITTSKMLEFVNKRTDREVIYKPTTKTMITTFTAFIAISFGLFKIFMAAKPFFTNWILWLVGSLAVYVTCVSGVIYDIIHDVPFVGRHRETGEVMIFADGNREQYGAEGLVISVMIVSIGLLFVLVIYMNQKLDQKVSLIGSLIALVVIYWLVGQLESIYKSKSWYGPSFHPPGGYLMGSITSDQGNNI